MYKIGNEYFPIYTCDQAMIDNYGLEQTDYAREFVIVKGTIFFISAL